MNEIEALKFAQNLVGEQNRVVMLVKFGSNLYGTNTPQSDVDYKGIFIPSLDSCILGNAPKSFDYSSGKNDSRNTADDIDMQLWSFQYWMKLIGNGDTNALDMLYAPSNEECCVFIDNDLTPMFQMHKLLYNKSELKGYMGYVLGQAKKYGLKGSRLGVIKKVHEWLETIDIEETDNRRIEDFDYKSALDKIGDVSYFFEKVIHDRPSLLLCGKVHNLNTKMFVLKERVAKIYNEYGHRAKLAELNQGIDYKAISHAIRATHQMKEILINGCISFPLVTAPELIRVKNGEMLWKEVEVMIVDGLREIDILLKENPPEKTKNRKHINRLILNWYK